ncbi:MAG: Fic family protein [Clostridiales bacterium]|nr:Fic family protein [Clostridiales bacterium]
MKHYDYSFLKNMKVPASFLSITNGIYALRSEEEQKRTTYPEIFTKLQQLAIVQSVKESNAIEGIITTDKRIEEIVNQNSAPLNHNEQEIAGYRDALNLIHTNYESISVDEFAVLNLHNILLSHTEFSMRGQYKREDNIIRERYPDGTSRVRWTPVSAKDTPNAMQQMYLAYMDARDDAGINQLLLIPCVILDFLCIHPFQDGNGRMSRLLSLLLLYKNGFDISKYISFEEQINKSKSLYYDALKKSSEGWHDNTNDYLPFIENFIFTLYLCYKELDKRFLTLNSGKVSKTKRVEETVLNAFMPISKKEICDLLVDVSPTTVEAVLSSMLKDGRIAKLGTTKNTRYVKNKLK